MTKYVTRAGFNYSGIALLLTSITGMLGLFWQQNYQGNETAMVQSTTFAVTQYRLQDAEKEIATLEGRLKELERLAINTHRHRTPRAPATAALKSAEIVSEPLLMTEGPVLTATVETPPEDAQRVLIDKVKTKKALNIKDVRDYVQKAQRPLQPEDF